MMRSGEEWVLEPAFRGLCSYEALVDGRLTLLDVARMNDAIRVRDENVRRADEAARKG